MKKLLLIAIALMITAPAFAWNDNYDDNGNEESYYEQDERQREAERNKEYPYESNTGTRYKYDLSNPADKVLYDVDPAAQVLDSVNPMVDIDRDMGQYGGGAE